MFKLKKFFASFFIVLFIFGFSKVFAQIQAIDTEAGKITNYKFTFGITNTLDPSATFSITFPTGFDASNVQIVGSTTMTGGFTNITATASSVTFNRDGTGNNASGVNHVITIGIVENPSSTGVTGTISFTGTNSGGAPLGSASVTGTVTITPSSLSYFTMTGVPGSVTAGSTFNSVVVTAKDVYSNDKTDYSGTVSWSSTDGSATLPTTGLTFSGASKTFNGFVLPTSGSQTITVSDGSISKESSVISVSAAASASFSLSNPGTQEAGSGFSLSITGAVDAYGNPVTGTATVAFSDAGAHNSPNSSSPTLANISVTNGSGSATQMLVNAETGVQLQATLGSITETTAAFTVNPTTLNGYTLSDPGNQTAGTGFNLNITDAVDTYGNGVNGTATIELLPAGSHNSPDGFSPSLQNIAVSGGAGNASQTLYKSENSVQLRTTMGGIQKTTTAFNVGVSSLSYIKVLNNASGNTSEVTAQTVGAGNSLTVHAGGFDAYGNYTGDESAGWSVSGGIGTMSPASGTSSTLTANTEGSGVIEADHATATDAVSGTITVTTGALSYVRVVEGLSGDGSTLGARTLKAGQTLTVHAAGYDATDNYLGDYSVTWTVSNGIGSFSSGSGASTVLTAETVGTGVITADHTSATDGTSGNITVNPGTLSYFTMSGVPGSVTAGTTFNSVIVTAKDVYGNNKTDYTGTVSWSSTDGSATLPATGLTFSGASKTFNGFVLSTAGNQTITVADGSISKESSVITVGAAAPASFNISNPGTQVAGSGFSLSITGAVDAFGNSVSGTATVAFSDAGAHQSPNSTSPTLTNIPVSNGSGSATQILVNAEAGVQLQATLGSISQSTTAFTVNASTLTGYALSNPGNQTAGTGFNLTITAAVDVYGNGVNGTATVELLPSGNHNSPDGFSPSLQTIAVSAASPGTGSATQTLYKSETGVQLRTTMGGIQKTSATFNVAVGGLSYVKVLSGASGNTAEVSTQTVGAGTAIPVHAGGFDTYGNYSGDESVSWSVTGGIGSMLPVSGSSSTLTASTEGSGAIKADHATATDGVSGTITVTQGALSYIRVVEGLSGDGSALGARTLTAGQSLTVHAAGYDATNNYLGDFSVNWTVSNGIGSFSSGSGSNTVLTAETVGNGVITADHATATDGASGTITVNYGSISTFQVAADSNGTNIGNKTAGQSFSIGVVAKDAYNNTVRNFTNTANLTDLSGDLNSTTGSFVKGVWTGQVTITKSKTTNSITATSSGKSGTSNTFNVNSAALDHFVFETISSPQTASSAFSVTITAKDVYENTVTSHTAAANLSANTGAGTYSPTTTSGGFTAGVWTGSVTITKAQSDVQLTANYSGKSGQSNLFNVSSGSLHHFVIGTITSPQTAGSPFNVTVTAQDIKDNTVTSFSGTIGISDLTGTITPNISDAFSNGVWTGNVTITQVKNNDKITVVRSGGTETGESNTFNVTTTNVDHFTISAITSPQVAGTPFSVKITAQDANNNTVTGYAGTVSLSDLTGMITPTTSGLFSNGVWTGNVTITKSQVSNKITATGAGKSGESNLFNVNPAALDHFVFENIASPQVAGTAFSITITAKDEFENTANFTGTANLSDNTTTLTPTTTGSFVSGVWTGNVSITKKQTDIKITAQSGLVTSSSNIFNIIPNSITYLKVRDAALGSGTEVGDRSVTLDETLVLYAAGYDQYGNFSRDVGATWSTSGNLDSPSPTTGQSTVFDPSTANTSGKIKADSSGLTFDETGTITVGAIAAIKIRDAASGQGNEIVNYTMTTDEDLILFAAGYDASNNFIGDVQVDWSGAVSATSTASVTFSPSTVETTGITATHSTAGSKSANITVNPGVPSGTITLTANPTALPADNSSTSTISSNTIRDADGNRVSSGTLITVSTTNGSITTPDASGSFNGRQIATTTSGRITFVLQAGSVGGTAFVSASSVTGSASGDVSVQITNLQILSVEAPSYVSQGQTTVPVTMTVKNIGSQPVTSVTANLTFTGPSSQNYNGDYSNRSKSGISIPANSTSTINFNVNVDANATTSTQITIDGGVDGFVGSEPISQSGAQTTDAWTVQTKAQLQILRIEADNDTVSRGQQNIQVKMFVRNNGQSQALITSSGINFKKGATNVNSQYTTSVESSPGAISGGATEEFAYVVDVTSGADLSAITIDGEISGKDGNSDVTISDSGADQTDSWLVIEAGVLQIPSIEVSQATVTQNQTGQWYIDIIVKNNGGAAFRLDNAQIKIYIGSDVTSEYTISTPTKFWNNGLQSSTLAAGSEDKIRFYVTQTGSTKGPATLQGKIWVTDVVSNQQLIEQSDGNSGRVTVQTPAQLTIKYVFPEKSTVTKGQTIPWKVLVNIENTGESSILINPSEAISKLQFKIGSTVLNDFVVVQPDGFSNQPGVFELVGGKTEFLPFTINQTTSTTGFCQITATIGGSEINSGRSVSRSGFSSVQVVSPAAVYVQSTTNSAVNQPNVNSGQTFTVDVAVYNGGGESVSSVNVTLESDGNSSFNSPLTIPRIASGASDTAKFTIVASNAASDFGATENFSAKITSALSENTGQQVPISPALDSTAIAVIRKPAGLQILSVYPTEQEVTAGQTFPNTWDVVVVVKDTGHASLIFNTPSVTDIDFTRQGIEQNDYLLIPPQNLQGGDLILGGGETDSLIYTVRTTGAFGGQIAIIANLTAKDQNDERSVSASGNGSVLVNTDAGLRIFRTILSANHPQDVNTRQLFNIQAEIENTGSEAVKDVHLSISSNGPSQILDSTKVVANIPASTNKFVLFSVKADSVENLLRETFTVKIDSAKSAVSNLPAAIREAFDDKAEVRIENPALAQLDLAIDDADGVLSADEILEVTLNIVNKGRATIVDTGLVELSIPQNYRKITSTDTSYFAKDTVKITMNNPVVWQFKTPPSGQGPDTLAAFWITPPKDENTDSLAQIYSPGDSTYLTTIGENQIISTSSIISPEGSADGTLSTEQEFLIRSIVVPSLNLTNTQVTLQIPGNYTSLSNLTQTVQNVGSDTLFWSIRTPENADQTEQNFVLKFQAQDEKGSLFTRDPDVLKIQTVKRANLSLNALISSPPGAANGVLSKGQSFTIRAIVTNLGQAGLYGMAEVKLDLGSTGITVSEDLTRSFVFDQGSATSVPIDWSANAPNIPTAPAFATVTILTLPKDENTDKQAFVTKEQVQLTFSTVESAQLSNELEIFSPDGAKDGIISTGQEFTVRATIGSENSTNIRVELILPGGTNFFTENAVKSANTGSDVVSWIVRAPSNPITNTKLKVITRAIDENSNQQIVSLPDSIIITVQNRASLVIDASTPKAKISVSEVFLISAFVKNNGEALITGEAELKLRLPSGFTTVDDTIKSTSGLSTSWTVTGPAIPTTVPQNIEVFLNTIPFDENTNAASSVAVSVDQIAISVERLQLMIANFEELIHTTIAKGDQNVPVFGLKLRNRGSSGSNPILVRGLRLIVKDKNGNAISPQSVFSRLKVCNFQDTTIVFGSLSSLQTDNPVTISFSNNIVLNPGPVTTLVGVYADILPSASNVTFSLAIEGNSGVDAVDSITQQGITFVNESGETINNLQFYANPSVILNPDFNTAFRNFPNPFGQQDRLVTNFVYYLENDSDVKLRIFTLTGDLVLERSYTAADPQGRKGIHEDDITWDGKNGSGFNVLNGVYVAVLSTGNGKRSITKVAYVK